MASDYQPKAPNRDPNPVAMAVSAMETFMQHGTVSLDYVNALTGGGTVSTVEAPRRIRVHRLTKHGRIIYDQDEIAERTCPYPHDPDL